MSLQIKYEEAMSQCESNPEEFWSKVAQNLHWDRKWDKIVDQSDLPFTRWFIGGQLNACYNCLDIRIENGMGEQAVYIHESPVTNSTKTVTYNEILEQVTKLAGLLRSLGVQKGDLVALYMPTILEGAYGFLACARIGAIHNAIPGGLPAEDLAVRIQHSEPKVILTASHGYHAGGWMNYKQELDQAIELSHHKPSKCIVFQREKMERVFMDTERDLDWVSATESSEPCECVPVAATDVLFVLYTSGSTGLPKAITHSVGSFIVRLNLDYRLAWSHREPGTIFFGTTSLGWIAGHSILVYAPLLFGIKSVFYEGDPLLMSDARALYKVISKHDVNAALIRPGILRAVKGMDPDGLIANEFKFKKFQIIYAAGEYIEEATMRWAYKIFKVPTLNAWGQSELAGTVTAQTDFSKLSEDNPFSFCGLPFPGWNIEIVREDMTLCSPGEVGRILIKLPLPPGGIHTLYKNDEIFRQTYFEAYPGYFDTKDEGYRTETGEVKMERRADDVIKAGAIYVSSTDIEKVLLRHSEISETAVVSQPHNTFREIPVAFVTLSTEGGRSKLSELTETLVYEVKKYFGKSMPFESVVIVKELPRTRTGKIHKSSLMSLLRKLDANSGGLENPHVIKAIQKDLEIVGII